MMTECVLSSSSVTFGYPMMNYDSWCDVQDCCADKNDDDVDDDECYIEWLCRMINGGNNDYVCFV